MEAANRETIMWLFIPHVTLCIYYREHRGDKPSADTMNENFNKVRLSSAQTSVVIFHFPSKTGKQSEIARTAKLLDSAYYMVLRSGSCHLK